MIKRYLYFVVALPPSCTYLQFINFRIQIPPSTTLYFPQIIFNKSYWTNIFKAFIKLLIFNNKL